MSRLQTHPLGSSPLLFEFAVLEWVWAYSFHQAWIPCSGIRLVGLLPAFSDFEVPVVSKVIMVFGQLYSSYSVSKPIVPLIALESLGYGR